MAELPPVLDGLKIIMCGTFPSGSSHKKLSRVAQSLGATTTTDPASSCLTHVVLSQVEAANPGAKARKASEQTGVHVVGLGWLLTSLAERRRVDEREGVANPLGEGGAGSTEGAGEIGDKLKAEAEVDGEAAAEAGTRRSGRARARVAAEAEEPIKVEGNGKAEEAEDSEPRLTTATTNAPHARFTQPGDHNLLEYDGAPCSATLNLTDLKKNSNKFYIIQAIGTSPTTVPPAFFTFLHWGRVGELGRTDSLGPFSTAQEAVDIFLDKFGLKTGLDWNERADPPVRGKYTLLQTSLEPGAHNASDVPDLKRQKLEDHLQPTCTLPDQVQALMAIMFDRAAVERTVAKYEYDASRLPLGQLSPVTIGQGLAALRAIGALLDAKEARVEDSVGFKARGGKPAASAALERKEFQRFSGDFYTLIPHVFGRATPPPIDSRDRLSREFELISTLSDLKLTASVLSAPSAAMHPLQQQYNSLGAELTPLAPESAARKTLAKMLAVETEGERGLWQLELVDGFEVSRAGEGMLKNAGERKLVWYGTQSTHWAGLISQGLKKPQAEARSGYLFGSGVYLASLPTKPASACYAQMSGGFGLLALCEVGLGDHPPFEAFKYSPKGDAQATSAGAAVTHAVGRIQPAGWVDAAGLGPALEGAQVAAFDKPAMQSQAVQTQLLHDEWVVYDEERVRIKFLCRVRFVDV